jgi:FkbM family methyltransferase
MNMTNQIQYTSQVGQDKWIVEEVFKGMTHGFFVDIGAYDGIIISNTYILEHRFQWDGICVEPHEGVFELLKKNRNCLVDNNFIYDGRDVMFHQYVGDINNWECFSSIVPFEEYEKNVQIIKKPVCRKSISLNSLLDNHKCSVIHYLSIDAEYLDFEILNHYFSHPNRKTIVALTVEHNFKPERDDLFNLLTVNGFVRHKELSHDDAYINEDFIHLVNL